MSDQTPPITGVSVIDTPKILEWPADTGNQEPSLSEPTANLFNDLHAEISQCDMVLTTAGNYHIPGSFWHHFSRRNHNRAQAGTWQPYRNSLCDQNTRQLDWETTHRNKETYGVIPVSRVYLHFRETRIRSSLSRFVQFYDRDHVRGWGKQTYFLDFLISPADLHI